MPDIPTLTSQAEELARTHSFWNSWSVIFVAVTAFAAVLYFVGQWMTNKRGNELTTAQAALIRAKDEQLARDLKDKDVLIADADKRAGEANEAAGKANERAGNLESQNLTLRGQVATLETAANDAKTQLAEQQGRTAILEKAANDARRQLAAQEGQTAELRRRAADAETELAQVKEYASLRLKSGEQLKVISERLKGLPRGKLKVFWAANDFDAYTIADNTVEVFRTLGWQVDGPERTLEALFPIAIASENPNDGPTTSAIIEAFRAAGFDARGSSTFKLPPDRIVIVVGSQQRRLFPENPRPKK